LRLSLGVNLFFKKDTKWSLFMLLTTTFAVDCENGFVKVIVKYTNDTAPQRVDDNIVNTDAI